LFNPEEKHNAETEKKLKHDLAVDGELGLQEVVQMVRDDNSDINWCLAQPKTY